jgi:ABC-type glycerol-3-phosphate transport system permease component
LAFTYLPFYLSAREGLPALGSLLSPENLNALRVTALYLLLTVPLSVGLGLAGALAVEGDSRLRLLARTLIFHPVVLPTVAFAAVFLYLLNPLGPLRPLLQAVGYQNPLGEPLSAFLSVALVGALKDAGLYMLYYLAGLKAIPHEVLEAALADGAGTRDLLLRVLVPANLPTLLALGITLFIGAWNQYVWPLLVANQPEMYVLTVAVQRFAGGEGANAWGPLMAASVLATLPALLLYLLFRRHILETFMEGGVRG